MIVCLVIHAGGPIGDVPDQRVSSHLVLGHFPTRTLEFLLVQLGCDNVCNKISFPYIRMKSFFVALRAFFEKWTLFEKNVMRSVYSCKKKRIAFIFVLPDPKRGEQSVGRDHIGATLGF